VANFASTPLEDVPGLPLDAHIKRVPKTVDCDMLSSLPFDLSFFATAQSGVAKDMLQRMEQDMRQSYERSKEGTATRLAYLDDSHIEALRMDLSATGTSLQRSHSNSMVRTLSTGGSSMLSTALCNLESLHGKLSEEQSRESMRVQQAVRAVEAMGNETTGEVNVTNGLRFYLLRFARQRLSPWFELLAEALLSSNAVSDLQRLNACLSEEQCARILEGVASVLFRSNRLSHLNRTITSVGRLCDEIRTVIENRVIAKWSGQAESPDKAMVRHALANTQYEGAKAAEMCQSLLNSLARLKSRAEGAAEAETIGLQGPELQSTVEIAFEFYGYDPETAFSALSASPKVAGEMLDAARRVVWYKGSPLAREKTPSRELHRSASATTTAGELNGMIHVLEHAAHEVAGNLSAARCYVDTSSLEASYDPRFLVFEYLSGFLLRKRQVQLIQDFARDAQGNKSRVEQMIMGQGKTTVIAPVLALMLTGGGKLVTQIVPDALLEMSREVMRGVFSSIVTKRIYTFAFDRSSGTSNSIASLKALRGKLQGAQNESAIVCTTPGAVKSLFLKYIDLLQGVDAAPLLLRCPTSELGSQAEAAVGMGEELSENAQKADEIGGILKLWRSGTALLDEVDLLLHPLKSELNFPIGAKKQLESHEFRWDLPMHLVEALFYPELRRVYNEEYRPDASAVKILMDIKHAIDEGRQSLLIQTSPHIALLSKEFYHDKLQEPMARWASVWLKQQPAVQTAVAWLAQRLSGGMEGGQDRDFSDALSDPTTMGTAYTEAQIWGHIVAYLEACSEEADSMVRKWFEQNHSVAVKMLNLAREWVGSFMAHVFGKIDRVSFGLLHPRDFELWERLEGSASPMPASRKYLAVPFVALEVPSRSSEFAHPEVVIGLTVLAYRYEGLRPEDMKRVIKAMGDEMANQSGPFPERAARVRFSEWLLDARRASSGSSVDEEREVLELELFQPEDAAQVANCVALLGRHPPVVQYFLRQMVFPAVLKKQTVKLQASGVDLGGEMLFQTRLGFSGTPSDLLPDGLKPCHFEPGSEAEIVRVLTNESLVSCEEFSLNRDEPGKAVRELLQHIATSKQANGKGYRALIDSGALITGIGNEGVARALLDSGLPHCQACVFLDPSDKKMVVERGASKPLPLNSCGVPKEKRFCFYDQVHTTGMDIKHALNACAVITIGKDMTLRDYAQGCYRMRGLGKGQTLHLLVVDEVMKLVRGVSNTAMPQVDVMAWLVHQSMRVESLQYTMLLKQNLANIWRMQAFQRLLGSSCPKKEETLTVAGVEYTFSRAGFGIQLATLSLPLVVAIPEFADREIDNPEALEGNIAVVLRGGDADFANKAKRVQAAGALGMICISCTKGDGEGNASGDRLFMMGPSADKTEPGSTARQVKIPCALVKESDGPAIIAAAGTAACLILGPGRYPLRSRFWGPIADADVKTMLETESLLTLEELEKIQKGKDDQKKADRAQMLVNRVAEQKGQEIVMSLVGEVRSLEDVSEMLDVVERFCDGHGVSTAEVDENTERIGKERKDLEAALEQAGAVLAPDMLRDMQAGVSSLSIPEQIQQLQGFCGITFDLPSMHLDEPETTKVAVAFDQGAMRRLGINLKQGERPEGDIYLDLMPGSNSRLPATRVVVGSKVIASHPSPLLLPCMDV